VLLENVISAGPGSVAPLRARMQS